MSNTSSEVRLYGKKNNEENPAFKEQFHHIMDRFFSRNEKYWSCFRTPTFKNIINFRKLNLNPEDRLTSYPEGDRLENELKGKNDVPHSFSTFDDTVDNVNDILGFAAALSKDWENPSSVENVITMPCDPGIYGSMMGSLCNANLVYHEYSGMANEIEKAVVRQMANLVGYDPEIATGIFTQGGTFCNLYGYLLGIRKSLPQSKERGLEGSDDYRIVNSVGGHYSNMTNLSVLGVNIESKTIRIHITENNDIDMVDLKRQLTACFRLHCKVPTIMLTMGTTDTFGVDHVKPVYDLRNELCEKFDIKIKPHIHVDSAIGWSLLFFLGYDFKNNPLDINENTLNGLKQTTEYFDQLRYADSFTIDFQKWGYVPYTSSLVMIKDKKDLAYLENDPENFSYFEKETQGYTHLQSTIECSRGAAGAFGAYAALNYMGVTGYQITIAHCLQNANYFRYRLSKLGFVKIIALENQGPSVGFRIYNREYVSNPEEEYKYEYAIQESDEYLERVERNSRWHREVFLKRGKIGLFTNWVEFISHTDYDEKGRFRKLPGEKAVFLNPAATRREIDLFVESITLNNQSE